MIFEQRLLDDLGESDLARLALVSSDYLEAARDSLYSRLSLRCQASTVWSDHERYSNPLAEALERTLCQSPTLAVRCKEMRVFFETRTQSGTLATRDRVWRVVEACAGLESLDIATDGNFHLQVPLGIGRSWTGLRSLYLESTYGNASDSALLAGLCSELVHLRHPAVNLANIHNFPHFPHTSFTLTMLQTNSRSSFLARWLTDLSEETLEELDMTVADYDVIGVSLFPGLTKLSLTTDIEELFVEELLDGFALPACGALRPFSFTANSARTHSLADGLFRLPITSLPLSLESLHLDIPKLNLSSLADYLRSPFASELHDLTLEGCEMPCEDLDELETVCEGCGIVFSAWSSHPVRSAVATGEVDLTILSLRRQEDYNGGRGQAAGANDCALGTLLRTESRWVERRESSWLVRLKSVKSMSERWTRTARREKGVRRLSTCRIPSSASHSTLSPLADCHQLQQHQLHRPTQLRQLPHRSFLPFQRDAPRALDHG